MEKKIPQEPKTDVYVKESILLAFLLGLPSFLLIFFFAQGFGWSLDHGGPVYIWGLGFFGVVVGYFMVLSYLLLRGNPRAIRKGWPIILALNITPLSMVLMIVVFERRLVPVLEGLGVLMFTVLSSFVGAILAQKIARRRMRDQ